jgi:branched-subunit amino acid aminotransferase/4-amino-4-deoxychorismate lyase
LNVFESWLSISSVVTSGLAAHDRRSREYSRPMHAPAPQYELSAPCAAQAAHGVYDTLLVVDGRPISALRHLERLRASARALYGLTLEPGLEEQLEVAAARCDLGRLRIELVPHTPAPPAIGFVLGAIERAIVLPGEEVDLATVRVAGGAGAHKLLDRSWFEQIEALAGAGVRPLLVTASGELLETTRANVFLLRDGALATPPADGSILAGTVRASVLEHAARLGIEARELPLTLAQLDEADIVVLSGSVRLLERARVRGGRRSADAFERLAGALAADALG